MKQCWLILKLNRAVYHFRCFEKQASAQGTAHLSCLARMTMVNGLLEPFTKPTLPTQVNQAVVTVNFSPMSSKQFFWSHLRLSKPTTHCWSLNKSRKMQHSSTSHNMVCKPNSSSLTELFLKSKQSWDKFPLRKAVSKFLAYFQGSSLGDWLKPCNEGGETCQSN